jgi:hypothetical protein
MLDQGYPELDFHGAIDAFFGLSGNIYQLFLLELWQAKKELIISLFNRFHQGFLFLNCHLLTLIQHLLKW